MPCCQGVTFRHRYLHLNQKSGKIWSLSSKWNIEVHSAYWMFFDKIPFLFSLKKWEIKLLVYLWLVFLSILWQIRQIFNATKLRKKNLDSVSGILSDNKGSFLFQCGLSNNRFSHPCVEEKGSKWVPSIIILKDFAGPWTTHSLGFTTASC
jgi:hypothetical protein